MSDALFDVPSHGVDERTAELLSRLAHAPDPNGEYPRIVAAIIKAANANRGVVTANEVRPHLLAEDGQTLLVNGSRIGSAFRTLALAGVLKKDGHVINDDHRTGNAGKPTIRWRLL